MSRGLPWSLLLHVLVLTVVIVYGNTVQRDVIEPPRYIQARIVTAAALEQAVPQEEEAPAPEPEPEPPAAEPEPLPPKEVPETRPQPEPEPVKPEPKPEPRREEPRETEAATRTQEPQAQAEGQTLGVVGPSVSGTDTDFPFAWYIAGIEGQIARNWRPFQVNSPLSCTVHFVVGRGGAISQVTLVRSSGVGVYDREALRAVQATRLSPLPPQYGGSTLGITFIFNSKPGL
jgi:TonB family protein